MLFIVTQAENRLEVYKNAVGVSASANTGIADYVIFPNGNIFKTFKKENLQPNQISLSKNFRELLGVNIGDSIKMSPIFEKDLKQLSVANIKVRAYETIIFDNKEDFYKHVYRSLSGCYINPECTYMVVVGGVAFSIVFQTGGIVSTMPNFNIQEHNKNLVFLTEQTSCGLTTTKIDFKSLGIGGLDSEAGELFTRAFSSRLLKNKTVEALGIRHVKGILLHGPPGTGKTLIARKLANLLGDNVVTKVVNGPELLNKFVGESEKNIRDLFLPAEQNPEKMYVIIFDEIDSLCKKRGSGGTSGVGDNLVIGMTNRLDRLDEAVIRPGRLEVHIKIGLPNENGRRDILEIHTSKMRENGFMVGDVDDIINYLSRKTENFSGADLEALVGKATTFAIESSMIDGVVKDDNIKITEEHFNKALGTNTSISANTSANTCSSGIINPKITPGDVTFLYGDRRSGKVSSVTSTMKSLGSTNIKILTNRNFLEMLDDAKALYLVKEVLALESIPGSTLILRNIEDIIGVQPTPFLLNTLNTLLREKPLGLTVVLTSNEAVTKINNCLIDNFVEHCGDVVASL